MNLKRILANARLMNRGLLLIILVFIMTHMVFSQVEILRPLQDSTRNIARQVLPTVVTIDTRSTVKVPVRDFGFFFSPFGPFGGGEEGEPPTREFEQEGLGSGIFVKRDGNTYYILTNAHVVAEADDIAVLTRDEKEFEAELVGLDKGRDLALLSIKSKKDEFSLATLGNSDALQQGDIVFAVGNPYGFRSSMTFGIVSALDREANPGEEMSLTNYIQTDAAVNRGNSGGPLVNISGEVIGINTWIYSSGGGNVGLSFAVPINNAKTVIDDFIETGSVSYGWLGATIGKVYKKEMRSLDVEDGVIVLGVYADSPAERFGVKPGDIILSVNGKKVSNDRDLVNKITEIRPGEVAALDMNRDGKSINIDVTLETREVNKKREDIGKVWPGFSVLDITDELEKRLSLSSSNGAVVVAVERGESAAIAGMQAGDVIQRVNGKKIKNIREFYREIESIKKGEEAVFRIIRQDTSLVIGIVYGEGDDN